MVDESTKEKDATDDGSANVEEEEEQGSLEIVGDSEDSGSAASDLEKSNNNKKSKKLKKFFNFSRKKEKVVWPLSTIDEFISTSIKNFDVNWKRLGGCKIFANSIYGWPYIVMKNR